ncbi:MAG: DUF488 domain-containing protein [Deltaproteobacteria bacterium]|nr:DUF488 domain-containing protein [Deltaproteobacteria bacterium]
MSDEFADTTIVLYTIGHSNHSWEHFRDLLGRAGIETLVDVRSQPYSRYTEHFSAKPLRSAVEAAGLRYVFQGEALGGRPDGGEYYDEEGRVRYYEVARSSAFLSGIDALLEEAGQRRAAMMCAEENPESCHRRLLIARVLQDRGVRIRHVRGDGRIQTEEELTAEIDAKNPKAKQLDLFGSPKDMESEWKSSRSVLPKHPPENFLRN